MTGPPQIDLGVYSFEPEADPEPVSERGGWGPEWHRLRRGLPRRWLAALLVPLLLVTANSAPRQPPLMPLWEAPGRLLASGTTGYGMAQSGRVTTVTAYHLADGAVRWEHQLPGSRGWSEPSLVGDALLLQDSNSGSVVALDTGTGQQRWRREGQPGILAQRWPIPTVAERWLFFSVSGGAPSGGTLEILPSDDQAPYVVAMMDIRTGETAWTAEFHPHEEPLHVVSEYLLTGQPSGRLTSYDPATGRVLAVAEVDRVGLQNPTVVGDLLVLPDRSGVAAYEIETLRERWRLAAAEGWAAACGTLVCAYGDGVLHGLEPQTGGTRWSRGCDDLAVDPDPAADPAACHLQPLITDTVTMLQRATVNGDDTVATYLTVDPATGELDAELTGWWPTELRRGDRTLMISRDPSPSGEADARAWLGWWRANSPGPELLGPVDAEWCGHLTGDYLICWRLDPSTGGQADWWVWRAG